VPAQGPGAEQPVHQTQTVPSLFGLEGIKAAAKLVASHPAKAPPGLASGRRSGTAWRRQRQGWRHWFAGQLEAPWRQRSVATRASRRRAAWPCPWPIPRSWPAHRAAERAEPTARSGQTAPELSASWSGRTPGRPPGHSYSQPAAGPAREASTCSRRLSGKASATTRGL